MSDDVFSDRLIEAIECEGPKRNANHAEGAIDAIFSFTTSVLKIVAPHVPCVKFQSAYFEKYLWEGVEAYYSLLQEAAELDLLVIGDVQRGDIGATATAYDAAHLAEPPFDARNDIRMPDAI